MYPFCSKENEKKSSVCEGWNGTIKAKMYSDILPKIVSSYNNSKNTSIGMTPNKTRKPENYGKVYFNLYADMPDLDKTAKFKIGDTVRMSKYKRKTFDIGYITNWTKEVFIIDKIKPTDPITYGIKDLNGEEIKGSFFMLKSYKRQVSKSLE